MVRSHYSLRLSVCRPAIAVLLLIQRNSAARSPLRRRLYISLCTFVDVATLLTISVQKFVVFLYFLIFRIFFFIFIFILAPPLIDDDGSQRRATFNAIFVELVLILRMNV